MPELPFGKVLLSIGTVAEKGWKISSNKECPGAVIAAGFARQDCGQHESKAADFIARSTSAWRAAISFKVMLRVAAYICRQFSLSAIISKAVAANGDTGRQK